MSEIYTVIVVILGILAVSGLFVGVSNDAVNFLNSAIGSKAAPMKTILLVASIGILLGTVTSSGMMEVARNGMFNPGLFSFHEVMMLYMGVMFANVILLDLYNSMGLPTSTTVSLIFCLLGAAVAVSIYKISNDEALGMGDLNHFINTGRAMGIVSAILLSVVIAFTFGTLIMYISRLIFSFRYTAMFRRFGAFWCGASFTAILYFAVFKENRKVLREMVRESNELFYQSRERKYSLLPTLRKLQKGDIDTAHYYVQVVDYLNEMTKALAHITRPAFEHIDNNHEGLSKEQTEDLMHINDEVESIYRHINNMLRTGDFSDLDMVLEMRDRLFEAIADAIKSEVTRINENRSNTKASILYLTILNETKSMVLQSRNLLKSQRYFLEHKDGPLQWLNKIK